MISLVTAAEWDNGVRYENNDMKVTIENWAWIPFFGSDLGYIELKSHKSVNHILKVAPGNDRVVMYYDFNFSEIYKNGLGEIEFINITDGEGIEKDYHFVIWGTIIEEENNYSTICNDVNSEINNSYYESCEQIFEGTYIEEREGWVEFNTNDIPKGEVRIGIATGVNLGDIIDGVWTIAGKKIKKHAVWTADLNVGLISYWKWDDNNFSDSFGLNDGANSGTINGSGIIESGRDFNDDGDYINLGSDSSLDITGDFSFSTWIKPTTSQDGTLIGRGTGTDQYWIYYQGASDQIQVLMNGGVNSSPSSITKDVWNHVVVTYRDSDNEVNIYINAGTPATGTVGELVSHPASDTIIGVDPRDLGGFNYRGAYDETAIWNRTINFSSVTQLYDEGLAITWTDVFFKILVTLNEPENNTIQNDATVDFNWMITPLGLNITNWTLTVWYENNTLAHQHINTTINTDQITTVIHNDTLFLDESYIWNVESCGTNGFNTTCDLSDNFTFTLDTTPPVVNITYPPEGFIVTDPLQNITLNYTVVHPVGNLSNCFFNTTSNSTPTIINCTSNTTSLLYPIDNPDNLTIYVFANDTASNLGVDNVTIFKDIVSPQINVTSPTGILIFGIIGGNETLNITTTDVNLDTCWYNYNGTNVTIDGCLTGVENSTEFILEMNNLNMTIYANDTLGNTNSSFVEWEYLFNNIEVNYTTPQYESTQGVFILNTDIKDGETISEAIFNYNGTNYSTSIITSAGQYIITSSILLPSVNVDTNFTFNFIVIVDGITYSFSEETQEVLNIGFITCIGTEELLINISLFDEGDKTSLIGDIELNIQVYSKTSDGIVAEINNTYEDVHSQLICLSPNASYSNLYINAEMRYFKDEYATEFYHIQKADLVDYPINLSLFDLKNNDSTEFSVSYKNNAFIFVEGAIIQLQRKYIGQDIYETVEAPVTGDGGKAILHIDLNTNKYRASIVKDGELLDSFENIVFNCDNELSGDCTHSLEGTVSPNNDIPVETITDFTYSISIDEDNQTVTVLFAVPSGTPSTINVVLNQIDMFGNLTSCNTTVITSAGSISCDYTDSIEANILELSISKNGVQLAILSFVNDPELDMDGINFFIVFLFTISLVGMAISSPEWMIIISVMVLMISGTLLLVSGMNLVIGLGAIAWLLVAAGIIIFKMAKQEDR